MRRFALILFLAILPAAFAATAAATPPAVEEFQDEVSFDIDCGTFLLHEDAVVKDRITTFFDKAGNPTRIQIHERFVGVITNPDGETFRDPGFFTIMIDLAGTPEDESDDTFTIAVMFFGSRPRRRHGRSGHRPAHSDSQRRHHPRPPRGLCARARAADLSGDGVKGETCGRPTDGARLTRPGGPSNTGTWLLPSPSPPLSHQASSSDPPAAGSRSARLAVTSAYRV